jgi:hypothetical protein
MASVQEILAAAADPAYRPTATVRIAFIDAALLAEHAELDAKLPTFTSDTIESHPERRATAERIAEIEEAIEAAPAFEFRFESIGNKAWADLMAKHPPTRAQRAENRVIDHNPVTFWPDAIAACCADPKMTVDEVNELRKSANVRVQDWEKLQQAVRRVQVGEPAPKSTAAQWIRQMNGESEKRPTTTESPEADS